MDDSDPVGRPPAVGALRRRRPTPGPAHGLVLCHGLPNGPRGATTVGTTYPELADHIAREAGLARAHVQLPRHRARPTATSPPAAGSTTCAPRCACSTIATTCAASGWPASGTAARSRCAKPPTTTRARRRDPRGAEHAARLGARPRAPPRARARDGHDPHAGLPARRDRAGCARSRASTRSRPPSRLDGRPLLVLHGVDDAEVPVDDARALADAVGAQLPSSGWCRAPGHRLRHDPRAIATLLGWLDRQVPSSQRGRRRGRRRACRSSGISGAPSGRRSEPGGVADQHRHVDRPHQVGVDDEPERAACEREQACSRGRRPAHRVARAHVVDLPRAHRASASSRYARTTSRTSLKSRTASTFPTAMSSAPSRSAAGDARARAPGTRKLRGLPGPGVAEGTDADDAEALLADRGQRERLGRHLAPRVGRDRPERCALDEVGVAGLDPPVLLRAPDTTVRCDAGGRARPRARSRCRRRSPCARRHRRPTTRPRGSGPPGGRSRRGARARSACTTASRSVMSNGSAPCTSSPTTSSPSTWRCAGRWRPTNPPAPVRARATRTSARGAGGRAPTARPRCRPRVSAHSFVSAPTRSADVSGRSAELIAAGQRVDVGGRDQQRCVAEHLRERAGRGGHDRHAGVHRLERRMPEALVERREGEQRAPASRSSRSVSAT